MVGSEGRRVLRYAIAFSSLAALCLLVIAVFPSPIVVLLIGLVAMSCGNYFIGGRDVLYPGFMYTAVWALVAGAFLVCPEKVDPLGWKSVTVFLAGGASFSVGSLIGNRSILRSNGDESRPLEIADSNAQFRNALVLCTVVTTFLFLIIILRSAGGLLYLAINLLMLLNGADSPLYDADSLSPASSAFILSAALLPILTLWVLLMEDKRRWKIWLCVVCIAIFQVLVTRRGLVMGAFCGSVTLILLKAKDRTIRKAGLPLSIAALGIVILMAVMSLTKYWAQGPNRISPASGAWHYITGPLAAFDYYVEHPDEYADQPAAVFDQILTPLSRLGLIRYQTLMEVDGSSLDRFLEVPFPANVYTAYKPYYHDFGPLGCFAAFAFFGFVEGLLFYRATRGGPIAAFFLAHLAGSLMFSTFDDVYHGLSRHLNILVFAIGYFWLLKRVRIRL
jgi:oligosaccharide repeat unit polymerase